MFDLDLIVEFYYCRTTKNYIANMYLLQSCYFFAEISIERNTEVVNSQII